MAGVVSGSDIGKEEFDLADALFAVEVAKANAPKVSR